MRILFTNRALEGRGGSESYLETVVSEVGRLGHEVIVFSPRCGAVAERLRDSGVTVVDRVSEIPRDIDVIHGQHLDAVGAVRERFTDTPLVFVTHSWFLRIEEPVLELGASRYVALNEITRRQLTVRAGVAPAAVVRLTQPVSLPLADNGRDPIAAAPTVALASSRSLRTRIDQIEHACARRGIALRVVGPAGRESPDPRIEMLSSDIVFAVGRTALEAMALARAVFVLDESSIGGWVDASSYPRLEAAGFTGTGAEPAPLDLEGLLGSYTPALGTTARTLAVARHAAPLHAARLVEVYREAAGTAPGEATAAGLTELATENWTLTHRVRDVEQGAARYLRDSSLLSAANQELRVRVEELERQLAQLQGSLSWRATAPLRGLRALRRR